ncbi:MAG TPA: methyltransferase domain-containing protein [Tepidisphaeraceae bacterium]|nr:methyltransferase domain-containing protein [Tepidisphaeraceae bacterium]
MDGQYVQYGCGLCAPDGWLNFDASPTLRAQRMPIIGRVIGSRLGPAFPAAVRYGDIRAGLPVPDGSCAGVYCSHVLEHLALSDFRKALANTYRILRPGGRFRLIMPNLRLLAEEYMAADNADAAIQFMMESCLGQRQRPHGFKGMLHEWIGNAQHRWMWDYPSLERELRQTGFINIRPAKMGDSGDAHFAACEEANRWHKCLSADCIRPA